MGRVISFLPSVKIPLKNVASLNCYRVVAIFFQIHRSFSAEMDTHTLKHAAHGAHRQADSEGGADLQTVKQLLRSLSVGSEGSYEDASASSRSG